MCEIDLNKLFLDSSKLDKNYIIYEDNRDKVNEFEHNDLINDYLIEHIRRFNATAEYLLHSLQRLNIFAQILSSGQTLTMINNTPVDVQKEHRVACRDTCINIDIYIEVIKSFCRYYFFMDKKATDDGKIWLKAFENYKMIKGWIHIKKFVDLCRTLYDHPDTKLIVDIRNSEAHNESPLELIIYSFNGSIPIPQPKEYVISSETLHNQIVNVIKMLISTKQALQDLLENVTPFSIRNYLLPNDGKLKHIIKMSERYKIERIYSSKFSKIQQ